jgi:putative ABC transport system substrate-binding protein
MLGFIASAMGKKFLLILAALAAMPVDVDALYVIHSLFITSHVELLVRTVIAKKIPIASGSAKFKQGFTVSYGLDRFEVGQQVSSIALNVLRGGRPAEIPTEMAYFHLGINLKTATASGVTISNDILSTANQIVRQ